MAEAEQDKPSNKGKSVVEVSTTALIIGLANNYLSEEKSLHNVLTIVAPVIGYGTGVLVAHTTKAIERYFAFRSLDQLIKDQERILKTPNLSNARKKRCEEKIDELRELKQKEILKKFDIK